MALRYVLLFGVVFKDLSWGSAFAAHVRRADLYQRS